MFNDLRVSSSITSQVPQYYPGEYPTLINFLKDYYKFLESNSNPLDLINGTQQLVDIDTYSGVDLTARLKTPVIQGQDEIVVLDHVEFPKNNGLLKINDEVIYYKSRDHIQDEFGAYKLTVFSGCTRGFTYNDLNIDTGFTPNIPTVDSFHTATSVVYNQSYAYILYFLEKLREQYLADFPKNTLTNNIGNLNFNVLLKRIKDFYLSKGTPSGIDFYFKFLFQKAPELINYNEYLMTTSDAIYQSKNIVRIATLDNYYIPDLQNNSLMQLDNEYPVQTIENVYTFSSQVYEAELANAESILPTNYTIITSNIQDNKLYVDSTYGFADSGYLRINDLLIEYSDKEENYFIIESFPEYYSLGEKVYDGRTLATVKDRPDSFFVIYAGVSGFDEGVDFTNYQVGDLGFVTEIITEDSLLISGWQFNDILPVELRYDFLPGVASVYTDLTSVYVYTSGLPYYDITSSTYLTNNNIVIEDAKILKKIPRTFTKKPEGFRNITIPDSTIGFLRDGTPIYNWKSSFNIVRGSVTSIDIIEGGDDYNVNNPPTLTIDAPLLENGTTATADLKINGSIKDVYILDRGNSYPSNVVISVEKDPTDNVYTGDNFRPATLRPIIVNGKLSKVRIIDPGMGYTKQPLVHISPSYNITRDLLPENTTTSFDAQIELLVSGPIDQVVITDSGSKYDRDPGYNITYGTAASGTLGIENGRIISAQVVNAGNGYNSPPIVRVVDASNQGFGAKIYANWNSQTKSIDGYTVLNPGINYSDIDTYIEVYESGSDSILGINVERWNLVKNWDSTIDNYFFSDNGGYLYGDNVIVDSTNTELIFESQPYRQYTRIVDNAVITNPDGSTIEGSRLQYFPSGDAHLPNGIAAFEPPIDEVKMDLLAFRGLEEVIDEGTLNIQVPFNITFGSTSTNPTSVSEGNYININSNGYITFFNNPDTDIQSGWATEQLTPTTVGPAIIVGRDDLVIDQAYAAVYGTPDDELNNTRVFVIRVEAFHFDKGFNKTNPMKFEVVFFEDTSQYDNPFVINIIENIPTTLDNSEILITFSDDNNFEFPPVQAATGTTHYYEVRSINPTPPKLGKRYSILGFPKQLKLVDQADGRAKSIALNVNNGHSPIIGWALDGAPIYGPFGYSNPLDEGSDLIRMVSGYQIKSINEVPQIRREGILTTYTIGSFQEDYKWNIDIATLDRQNGRYCVTPEYPEGVYAYFMTINFNNRRLGYPYFIGSEYSGEVYEVFNSLEGTRPENLTNVKRYLSPYANAIPKPLDLGRFEVSSVPVSAEAEVTNITVISGGSGYKIGDSVKFNNEGTDGFGAAGFVSVLRGKPITSVTSSLYDLLIYKNENIPFQIGSTVKSPNGFSADIYAVDQINKRAYLQNVTGTLPIRDEQIYDTNLTTQLQTFTEITGIDLTTPVISATLQSADCLDEISTATKLIQLNNFANCTINDFFSNYKKIIKVNSELMRVLKIDPINNNILVERGFNSGISSHNAGSTLTILDEVDVFDSSEFLVGDIIKIDNEIFKVAGIRVEKQYQVVSTQIVDGTGTQFGTPYYFYLDGIKQENSNAPIGTPFDQAVVELDSDGNVANIVFDTNVYTYAANPLAQISSQSTYDPDDIVSGVTIEATTYKHTLVLERGAYETSVASHFPRTKLYRLTFVNGRVDSYVEDQRLVRLSIQNPEIVLNEKITVSAATKQTVNYDIVYSYNNGSPTLTGIPSTLVLYEDSIYNFNVDATSDKIFVNFYSPSDTLNKQREYFDLDTTRVFNIADELESFRIEPKDFNLTEILMRISGSNGAYVDVHLQVLPEPINSDYIVVNTANNFIEIPSENPILFESKYNQSNIKYTTTSPTATGGIETVTLSSGGFSYKAVPIVSEIVTTSGTGAILEAVSDIIGKIKSITPVNSGYGYNPNPALKPTLVFPKIVKITKNFIVKSISIRDPGEGYLFTPNIVATGGGLADGSRDHVRVTPVISNERLRDVIIEYPGVGYSAAPILTMEKLFFCSVNAGGEILFKFSFRQYIQEDDSFILRAFYDANDPSKYVETDTFYANIGAASISAKPSPGLVLTVNPLDDLVIPDNLPVLNYQLVLADRNAELTAIVEKSTFIDGEKVIFNNNPALFGFVSSNKGWQPNNSILRIEKSNYEPNIDDRVTGASSSSFGFISTAYGVQRNGNLSALIETPKQFLNTKSYLGLNALKVQDSFRYQKFAYEIGIDEPFNNWKDNYQTVAHPTGFNLFAKTSISSVVSAKPTAKTDVKIATDIASVARLRQRNNYLITKNAGFDEVEVKNKLLTDVKEIQTAIVGTFEDFSDQFDGVKTAFDLNILDPVTQTYLQPDEYDIDQMVVLLDNIIQTYDTSWTVIDSSKVFSFDAVKDLGEDLPDSETLTYRQFNEDAAIYSYSVTVGGSTDTFTLEQEDNSPFPSSVFSPVDPNKWLVFVDGVHQQASSYTITADTITFSENILADSQISVRYISTLTKNEFTSSSVTSGTAISLANKPAVTSKESYFVFVDGVLLPTSLYSLDGNNDIVFNISFNYDSLSVCIDELGVSLESSTHNLVFNLYRYKIEDGQTEIPAGLTLRAAGYILDISGIVQTPEIAYTTVTSGVRQILFNEAPQKYVNPDRTVGRQFVGLLYQRADAAGVSSTPNYQFDDVSRNIINVKDDPSNFIVGDFVVTPTSSGQIVEINNTQNRKLIETGFTGSVTSGSSFDIILSDVLDLYVGDRVVFNAAFGLSDVDGNELEISSINSVDKRVTLTNISNSTVSITIQNDVSVRFYRRYFVIQQLVTTVPDRDNSFVSNDTLLSGFISSERTGIVTVADEEFGIIDVDTEITVTDASIFAINDYALIDNNEVVKITNIVGNTLTVLRPQLNTITPLSYGNGVTLEKIIPQECTVSSFIRGFDGDKTAFVLKEKGDPVFIESNKDIFVIVNGILQQRGTSYQLNEVGGAYSEIVFFEPPQDGTPFNCFYVGETIAIQDISPQFNGVDILYDLRSTTGEIFSLLVENEPNVNVSANLILFIDGVYQIPSSNLEDGVQSYPDELSAFKLLGSSIQFTSPPKNGSKFEGYIYVGSSDDYKSTDIDATVEAGDVLIQQNEVAPRRILAITSATKVSALASQGQVVTTPNAGIELEAGELGWWKTDVLRSARIRESLRMRRTIASTITGFDSNPPFPQAGQKLLDTVAIQTIELDNISSDLPVSPDDDSNVVSFILPATTNFVERAINATYTSFVPRLTSNTGSDELQGVKFGYDLPFNQIVKLDVSASSETFEDSNFVGYGVKPYVTLTWQSSLYSATIIRWDIENRLLYLKTDTAITNGEVLDNFPYTVTSDNLIAEYQGLFTGAKFIYNF
jgi:hypothetical protein